jgi:PAS domain S-box-containing protein
VLESARVVREGDEQFVVGTLADVTAVRELEERASELSASFASVFESRSFGASVLDGQLRVVKANHTFCAQVGVDQESIVGMSLALFAPEAVEGLGADVRAVLAGGQPEPLRRFAIKGPEGGLQPALVEIRALPQPTPRAVLTLIVQNIR